MAQPWMSKVASLQVGHKIKSITLPDGGSELAVEFKQTRKRRSFQSWVIPKPKCLRIPRSCNTSVAARAWGPKPGRSLQTCCTLPDTYKSCPRKAGKVGEDPIELPRRSAQFNFPLGSLLLPAGTWEDRRGHSIEPMQHTPGGECGYILDL